MLNAMEELEIEVPCPVCSEPYTVSVETIRESQRLIAEGCPGTSTCDCAAHYYATLLPPEAVAQFPDAPGDEEESCAPIACC